MTVAAVGRTARRAPLDPGPSIDPFALAGQGGILFCSGNRIRVGLGVAFTVELPDGLDSPADLRAPRSSWRPWPLTTASTVVSRHEPGRAAA